MSSIAGRANLSRAALAIGAALAVGGMVWGGVVQAQAPAGAAAPAAPQTPRTPDGKPDLRGLYVGGVGGGSNLPTGEGGANFASRDGTFFGFEEDNGLSRMSLRLWPSYKPEHWDLVQQNDYDGNFEDPVQKCYPESPPTLGIPDQIIKVEGQPAYIFAYASGFSGYLNRYLNQQQYRWVWTDGRPHDIAVVIQESWLGEAVGKWEGDTFVVDTIGFTDESWLSRAGWPHGFNMRVTERITRVGNQLRWEATVEDPDYFAEPWVLRPMTANVNARPNAVMPVATPCYNPDAQLLVSPTQSG
jgi:hypothetical protein